MDRYERELEHRLRRREPSPDFASRVMAAVRSEVESTTPDRSTVVEMQPPSSRRRSMRWAVAGAIAASLLMGVAVEKRRADHRAALQAETQLYDALMLAGSKLHQARTKVQEPFLGGGDPARSPNEGVGGNTQ